MPFTPFHMGPGILIKALLQGSFSLMVFGWAQIVMDLQPLFMLVTGEGRLHGFSHTYVGATLLAIFSALSGKYLSESGLKLIGIAKKHNRSLTRISRNQKGFFPANPCTKSKGSTGYALITWRAAFGSALIGTYTHVALDSFMYGDVEPFYPLSQANSLLGLISAGELQQFCIYSAVVGAAIYYSVQYVTNKRNKAI